MPIRAVKQKASVLEKLYGDLDKAYAALAEFKNTHRRVFTQLASLEEEIEVIENNLKNQVRTVYAKKPSGTYEVFKGGQVSIEVAARAKRVFNVAALREVVEAFGHNPDGPEMEGLFSESVDLKMLDALVEGGKLDKKEVEACIAQRQAMTPAVTIKRVKEAAKNE